MEEKIFIKNRKGQKVSILIEKSKNQKGLVFVMHGLGGRKNQPHIKAIVNPFKENNYAIISFDTTNSYGESEGNFEDATVTNYYEDLEDVINWAKFQEWYQEPFCLVGHSIGSMCILLYTEKFPDKVKALAPISALVSGKLSLETKDSEGMDEWKEKGIKEWKSHSGFMKRLKWCHMEDRMKYDVLTESNKIKIPVILIVGEDDIATPLRHQQILYNSLNCKKEIHIIKEADHNFRGDNEEKNLKKLSEILNNWVKNLK
ncbi:MAG: alpha/beta fold hydrolase [Nanoarchaeota archaeon]